MGGILDFRTESVANTYNTTNTWKDSYNQSSTSTNALDNVGSMNITLPPANLLQSAAPIILGAGIAILAYALFRRR